MATNPTSDQDGYLDLTTQTVNADVALDLHIDGYTAFGNHYPDLVFLLCEGQATAGGESFIVDGQRLIGEIAGDPTQRALSRFLWDVTLEQSRLAGVGPAGTGAPVRSRRPVASRICAGASLCGATSTNASSMTPRPGRWTVSTSLPGHSSPGRMLKPRRGSSFNPAICSAWTTTGSSRAASPTSGMTGSCTRCGPGPIWPSGCPVLMTYSPPATWLLSQRRRGSRFGCPVPVDVG